MESEDTDTQGSMATREELDVMAGMDPCPLYWESPSEMPVTREEWRIWVQEDVE
jgi:hypothetical protein